MTLSTPSPNETRRFWRKDHRGFELISDVLPFGRLWYDEPNAVANAIGYTEHFSRSHDAVIRVYDEARNVIETHEHAGDFKSGSNAPGLLIAQDCLQNRWALVTGKKETGSTRRPARLISDRLEASVAANLIAEGDEHVIQFPGERVGIGSGLQTDYPECSLTAQRDLERAHCSGITLSGVAL